MVIYVYPLGINSTKIANTKWRCVRKQAEAEAQQRAPNISTKWTYARLTSKTNI